MQAMERRAKLDVHALWLLQPAEYLLVLACRSWSTVPSLMCMHCSQHVLPTVWHAGHGASYRLTCMHCGHPELLTDCWSCRAEYQF